MTKPTLFPAAAALLLTLSLTALPGREARAQDAQAAQEYQEYKGVLVQKDYASPYKVQTNYEIQKAAPQLQYNPGVYEIKTFEQPPAEGEVEAAVPEKLMPAFNDRYAPNYEVMKAMPNEQPTLDSPPRTCQSGGECGDDNDCTLDECNYCVEGNCNYDAPPNVCVHIRSKEERCMRPLSKCDLMAKKFGENSPEAFCCHQMMDAKKEAVAEKAKLAELADRGGAEAPGERGPAILTVAEDKGGFECCVETNKGRTPDQFVPMSKDSAMACMCKRPEALVFNFCMPCMTEEQAAEYETCSETSLARDGERAMVTRKLARTTPLKYDLPICKPMTCGSPAASESCDPANFFTWLGFKDLHPDMAASLIARGAESVNEGKAVKVTMRLPKDVCEKFGGTPGEPVEGRPDRPAQILKEADTAVLARAEQAPQEVLKLLGDGPSEKKELVLLKDVSTAGLAINQNKIAQEKIASGIRINNRPGGIQIPGPRLAADEVACTVVKPVRNCDTPAETPPIVEKPPVSVASTSEKPVLACLEGQDKAVVLGTNEIVQVDCPTFDTDTLRKMLMNPDAMNAGKRLYDAMHGDKNADTAKIRKDAVTRLQGWMDGEEYPVKPVLIPTASEEGKEKAVRIAEFTDSEKVKEHVRKNFDMKEDEGKFVAKAAATTASLFPAGTVEEIADEDGDDGHGKSKDKDKEDKGKGPDGEESDGETILPNPGGGTSIVPGGGAALEMATASDDILMNEFKAALEASGETEGVLVPQLYAHVQGGCGGCRVSTPSSRTERVMPIISVTLIFGFLAMIRGAAWATRRIHRRHRD